MQHDKIQNDVIELEPIAYHTIEHRKTKTKRNTKQHKAIQYKVKFDSMN